MAFPRLSRGRPTRSSPNGYRRTRTGWVANSPSRAKDAGLPTWAPIAWSTESTKDLGRSTSSPCGFAARSTERDNEVSRESDHAQTWRGRCSARSVVDDYNVCAPLGTAFQPQRRLSSRSGPMHCRRSCRRWMPHCSELTPLARAVKHPDLTNEVGMFWRFGETTQSALLRARPSPTELARRQ